MSDFLATGAAWLARQREQHLSTSVVYRRAGAGSVVVAAQRGRSEALLERSDGGAETVRSVDFLVSPSALLLGGAVQVPAPGDEIELSDGGKTITYVVGALGAEPCWRYSDHFRQTLRIHTAAR